jgi:hypothetical protein
MWAVLAIVVILMIAMFFYLFNELQFVRDQANEIFRVLSIRVDKNASDDQTIRDELKKNSSNDQMVRDELNNMTIGKFEPISIFNNIPIIDERLRRLEKDYKETAMAAQRTYHYLATQDQNFRRLELG